MNRATELSFAFLGGHPAGAARVLDQLSSADVAAFVEAAPDHEAAAALVLMQPARAAAVLSLCRPETAAALLSQAAAHARAVLLRALPEDARAAILAAAPRRQASALRRYLAYDPGTVGAWMDTPKATFAPDVVAGDCLARIRRLGTRLGTLVFVIDGAQQLLGTVDVETLLEADDAMPLGALMRKQPATLSPQSSIASVAALPAWDTALSMPVVDRGRRLAGVLHFNSLREGLAAEQGPGGGLQVNVVLMQLIQAFLVSLSGLLHAALTEPDVTRLQNARED